MRTASTRAGSAIVAATRVPSSVREQDRDGRYEREFPERLDVGQSSARNQTALRKPKHGQAREESPVVWFQPARSRWRHMSQIATGIDDKSMSDRYPTAPRFAPWRPRSDPNSTLPKAQHNATAVQIRACASGRETRIERLPPRGAAGGQEDSWGPRDDRVAHTGAIARVRIPTRPRAHGESRATRLRLG